MSHAPLDHPLKLDPWSASSLLQKAIRRGEGPLAQKAAVSLQRCRGQGVWRRLASIAVEDVGISDLGLVWDAIRLATDQDARQSRSPDLLVELINRLAAAPKDRSADYVFCGATKLDTAQQDRANFDLLDFNGKMSIATAALEPIPRRAVAALSACTAVKGDRLIVDETAARNFVAAFDYVPEPLLNSTMALTGRHSHPFGLMLVLIWSQYQFLGGALGYSNPPVPAPEWLDGIPLYTFDKHTAVGKRGIGRLVEENASLRLALRRHVPEQHWKAVAEMAAFYADAAPVSHRLEWEFGPLLAFIGFNADMTSAGCPMAAAPAVLKCVRENLTHLNQLRRTILTQGRRAF